MPIIVSIVLAFTCASWIRSSVYNDRLSLWADTVRKSPNKARPHYNLGMALREAFHLQEARLEFEKTLQLTPNDVHAMNNLATIYINIDRNYDALFLLQKVLALDPSYLSARSNLAMMYYRMNRVNDALMEYSRIMQIMPNSKEAAFAERMITLIDSQRRQQNITQDAL
jgi:Flp pilus assembly protein TadD